MIDGNRRKLQLIFAILLFPFSFLNLFDEHVRIIFRYSEIAEALE
jgi:hypothetical protein